MDFEDLGLTELIRLQTHISDVLTRRFERPLCFVFSDVVGSSEYTAKHGNESGRIVQQQHIDIVDRAAAAHRGRIVDTAGDGAFCVFERTDDAIAALTQIHEAVRSARAFAVRTGVHHGRALTDGVVVSGDAVNFCARIAASATPGEIRISRAAFQELESGARARCRALPLITLKGFGEVPVFAYEWRDLTRFPRAIRVVETGAELSLPDKDVVSIGRLRANPNGTPANDLVITLPDADKAVLLSRWHLELRRTPDGFVARPISERPVELNGRAVPKGHDVPVQVGDVLRLSGVLSLELLGESLTRSALSTRGGA